MDDIRQRILPTDEQMLALKRELNFIFWTPAVRGTPNALPVSVGQQASQEVVEINIQCTSHALVTAAIFMRSGFTVTTRAGMAFVLDASADSNPSDDLLNQIVKHWWVTLDGYGLVDLSLKARSENPLIYCNRSVGGYWRVAFGDTQRERDQFLRTRQRGCFYLTLNKQRVVASQLEQSLAQTVKPAQVSGPQVQYEHIVRHCENLLSGGVESLTSLSQGEAWSQLSR